MIHQRLWTRARFTYAHRYAGRQMDTTQLFSLCYNIHVKEKVYPTYEIIKVPTWLKQACLYPLSYDSCSRVDRVFRLHRRSDQPESPDE
jgi:hypothetical protein